MKKSGLLLVAFLMTAMFAMDVEASAGPEPVRQIKKSHPVEVIYFHMTRRCVTCRAVETVTGEAVREHFAEALKNGDVTFRSINLEDKENKALVKKMKVSGQSLLVVNGPDRIDITDKGFLYAKTDPDKLKTVVQETVGKFIK